MPKKRAPLQFAKPATTVHPSLSTSNTQPNRNSSRTLHSTEGVGNSVNELLQRQRLSSAKPTTRSERPQANISTVLPSWNSVLQAPETPIIRPQAGRFRRPAGPPPPTSWLHGRFDDPTYTGYEGVRACEPAARHLPACLKALPDLYVPHERSLIYQTLKALATNWDWHVQYDWCYLATIPVRYKEVLVGLIAYYGLHGVRASDLGILFLDETELEDATGSDGATHLDLSNSVGDGLSLKELKNYLVKKPIDFANVNPDDIDKIVPDAWEDPSLITIPHQPQPRFLFLTHLSLSHPRNPSWKQLLDLAPHLATLTHLSLAYWPTPSLIPCSTTVYRETPQGKVDYSIASDDSHSYWSEAGRILKQLSKATYCLKWLDLTGCNGCIYALQHFSFSTRAKAWRGLKCIKVSQGWIPEFLQETSTNWVYSWHESIADKNESERRASWLDLLKWAAYEENIESLRRGMRIQFTDVSNLSGAMEDNAGRVLEEERPAQTHPTAWWDEPTITASPSTHPEKGPHNTPAILDRGWDAWWIDDALHYLIFYIWAGYDSRRPTSYEKLEEFVRTWPKPDINVLPLGSISKELRNILAP